MKYLKMIGWIFTISLQRQLAHRANLLFELLLTTVSLLSGILAITAVFSHVNTLAGWSFGATIILLGTFQIVSSLINVFVAPNLTFFQPKVTNGEIDDFLIRPVSSLFLVSLGSCHPWALVQTALGVATVYLGVWIGDVTLNPFNVLSYLMLLCVGLIVAWASRVMLASIAFWAPGTEPSVIYDALWELGRYPIHVYQRYVRSLLTYLVPVALVSTFPARALVDGLNLKLFFTSLVVTIIFLLAVNWIWKAALKRYTSATS